MKRTFVVSILSLLLVTAGALRAADAVTIAAAQEMQENYKRLTATLEDLQMTQTSQQKQISALSSEVSKLRDELARNSNNTSQQDSIRRLNEQIVKVDESRIADNRRIQEALEKLGETMKKVSVNAPPRPVGGSATGVNSGGRVATARGSNNVAAIPDEGFEYTVQAGDNNLGVIVKRYTDEKIPVTRNAIMAANPNVDWTKLKIGQKIFIPKPKS
jgi:TolA-binding protein